MPAFGLRYRANSAHIRQSSPYSAPNFEVLVFTVKSSENYGLDCEVLETLQVVPSPIPSHILKHTHSLSHSLTHTPSQALSRTLSLSHTQTLSLTLTLSHTHSRSLRTQRPLDLDSLPTPDHAASLRVLGAKTVRTPKLEISQSIVNFIRPPDSLPTPDHAASLRVLGAKTVLTPKPELSQSIVNCVTPSN